MEKSILEKNIESISRYNKKLAQKLAEHEELNGEFEFLEAKTGDIILSFNGLLLHDGIDPQDEALGIFNSLSYNNKSSIHVLFGLGLGYLFKRFSLSSKGKIILFEPNLDILRLTLETVDFSEDLQKNSIVIVDTKEELQAYFEKFYTNDTEVSLSFLKSYAGLYPEKLKELVEELSFVKGLFACGHVNLGNKSNDWTFLGLANIPEVLNHYELEILRKKFRNKPAVIVSAGPSLDNNIEVLKEFEDKAVIFSVGTALKTVSAHNIKPDFLTVVEHNDCSFQVSGIDTSEINLILPPMTYKNFHTSNTKRRFNYYPNNDFTTKWLTKILDINLEDYLNKGTVSLCALFSARIMGCDPIIIIGQDLAYTNGNCYSQNGPYKYFKAVKKPGTEKFEIKVENYEEFLKQMDLTGRYSKEVLEFEAKKRVESLQKSLYSVKGHNGEMIPTESGYATFIRYFENTASQFENEIKFINATEGGAYLEGFEHIPLREALAKYANEKIEVESIIKESLKNSRDLYKEKGIEVLSEYDKTIEQINLTLRYLNEGTEYIKKVEKLYNLKRFSDDSFRKYIKKSLEIFLRIEEEIIKKNIVIYGLIFCTYNELSLHINHTDNIENLDSIKTFIELCSYFFEATPQLLNKNIPYFTSARKRLYENCYPKS